MYHIISGSITVVATFSTREECKVYLSRVENEWHILGAKTDLRNEGLVVCRDKPLVYLIVLCTPFCLFCK